MAIAYHPQLGFDVVRVAYMTYPEIAEIGNQSATICNRTPMSQVAAESFAAERAVEEFYSYRVEYAIYPSAISRAWYNLHEL